MAETKVFHQEEDFCEFCGNNEYIIGATLIQCTRCGVTYGRCNGLWRIDDETIPAKFDRRKEEKQMAKKCHQWTSDQENKLMKAVEDCRPLFEHYDKQSSVYTKLNAWDAIAGRMLPDVVVTGAACKRRFEKLMASHEAHPGWDEVAVMVNKYERELAETTFDGVAELLGNFDVLFGAVVKIKRDVDDLKKMWTE